jgi:hypothetical protein
MVKYIKFIIFLINNSLENKSSRKIFLFTLKNCRDNLQCSEICGLYHGFMPVTVEVVSFVNYLSFLDSLLSD